MTVADDVLDAAGTVDDKQPAPTSIVTWGHVRQASPLLVQFAGDTDTTGTRVVLKNEDYAPALDDKVVLLRVGRQWIAAFSYGSA